MTEKHAQFVGSVPELYHRHLGPMLFEPYARDLAGRVARKRPRRVLEVACGTGILTKHLRSGLPREVEIVATDLNEPMIEVARRVTGELENVRWRQADAMALGFADAEFDALACQFGYMFLPDKRAGFAEAARVLRPGGWLLFNVWGSLNENPFGRIAHEAIAGFVRGDPPTFYQTPFGFHNVNEIRSLLESVGFSQIDIQTLSLTLESESAEHAAIGFVKGNPVIADVQERGTAPVGDVVRAVARRLASEYGERPLRVPSRAHVVTARR